MSYMKRWLEDCSEELGFDGEINDEVMAQASPDRCPRAWKRAMDRAPRPNMENPALPFVKAVADVFGSGESLDEFCDRIFGNE